jgi:hypothetical protein
MKRLLDRKAAPGRRNARTPANLMHRRGREQAMNRPRTGSPGTYTMRVKRRPPREPIPAASLATGPRAPMSGSSKCKDHRLTPAHTPIQGERRRAPAALSGSPSPSFWESGPGGEGPLAALSGSPLPSFWERGLGGEGLSRALTAITKRGKMRNESHAPEREAGRRDHWSLHGTRRIAKLVSP